MLWLLANFAGWCNPLRHPSWKRGRDRDRDREYVCLHAASQLCHCLIQHRPALARLKEGLVVLMDNLLHLHAVDCDAGGRAKASEAYFRCGASGF